MILESWRHSKEPIFTPRCNFTNVRRVLYPSVKGLFLLGRGCIPCLRSLGRLDGCRGGLKSTLVNIASYRLKLSKGTTNPPRE